MLLAPLSPTSIEGDVRGSRDLARLQLKSSFAVKPDLYRGPSDAGGLASHTSLLRYCCDGCGCTLERIDIITVSKDAPAPPRGRHSLCPYRLVSSAPLGTPPAGRRSFRSDKFSEDLECPTTPISPARSQFAPHHPLRKFLRRDVGERPGGRIIRASGAISSASKGRRHDRSRDVSQYLQSDP
jgi:hypothetical protein